MFIGEYQHNIDEKGRLAIPAKFRIHLKSGAVVTKGVDSCLTLYTLEEWKKLADKVSALPLGRANTRAFTRLLLAGAMDVALDKQGRIVIPDYLRKFASIEKKTVIAGLFNRLEIWDETKWEKYKRVTEKESISIAETLGELGI